MVEFHRRLRIKAVWDSRGTLLLAIDYRDADGALRHIRFQSSQVAMFTPEEVAGDPGQHGAVDLGCSAWLQSFAQQHLGRCRHFRLLFYDELLDIICESLEFADGVFTPTA
jgi:hypothetical protein